MEEFKNDFPELYANENNQLLKIDENQMKSPTGKETWRKFIAKFEKIGPFLLFLFFVSLYLPDFTLNRFLCFVYSMGMYDSGRL